MAAEDGQAQDSEDDGFGEAAMHTLLLTIGYDLHNDRLCTQCTIPVMLRCYWWTPVRVIASVPGPRPPKHGPQTEVGERTKVGEHASRLGRIKTSVYV